MSFAVIFPTLLCRLLPQPMLFQYFNEMCGCHRLENTEAHIYAFVSFANQQLFMKGTGVSLLKGNVNLFLIFGNT